MLPLKIPLYREPGEYDPELYASWDRILEEMAAKDPAYQPALDAWREETAGFEAQERLNEHQIGERAATGVAVPTAPAPRLRRAAKKRTPRRDSRPAQEKIARR